MASQSRAWTKCPFTAGPFLLGRKAEKTPCVGERMGLLINFVFIVIRFEKFYNLKKIIALF